MMLIGRSVSTKVVVLIHDRHRPPISFQCADLDCLASRPAQILRLQQMLHRGCIGAAGLKRSFNGETHANVPARTAWSVSAVPPSLLFRFACRDGSSMTARSDRSYLATDQPGVAARAGASRPGHLVFVRAHQGNVPDRVLAGAARNIARGVPHSAPHATVRRTEHTLWLALAYQPATAPSSSS